MRSFGTKSVQFAKFMTLCPQSKKMNDSVTSIKVSIDLTVNTVAKSTHQIEGWTDCV